MELRSPRLWGTVCVLMPPKSSYADRVFTTEVVAFPGAVHIDEKKDFTPEQMLQFGIMGATLMADAKGRANPRVGLLNIGSEDIKGNGAVKQAGELLRQSNLNFVGNVEGNDIYSGAVDVVVCDGFTGNVALKTSEGLAHMVTTFLREEFTRNWFTRVCALFALPVLARFRRRVDSRRYNGASLLGLRGIVVKSHGGTDSLGFRCALEQAREEALADVIQHITEQVAGQLKAAATEA
jgi:glycerol-3-phosphate acyltransferase PlsX